MAPLGTLGDAYKFRNRRAFLGALSPRVFEEELIPPPPWEQLGAQLVEEQSGRS